MSGKSRIVLLATLVLASSAGLAWALGFQLGESKQQLKLDYDVSVYDHTTDRVTITFRIKDEGRLKPLTSVDLSIPSAEKHKGGGYKSDLTLAMALRKEDKQQVARIHIRKDWARRAEIHLKTGHLDGKLQPLTWYYHSIPLKDLVDRAKPHKTVR